MNKWNENRTAIFALPVIFLLGGALGWLIANNQKTSSIEAKQLRADVTTFKFVNPLLLSSSDGSKTQAFAPLVADVKKTISSSVAAGGVNSVSMYLRELNTGRWTGVNEDDTFNPSSMLKVVTMMAVLKLTEEEPGILNKSLYYVPDESTKFYRPGIDIKAGYRKVPDLINDMIVYSDNAAGAALLSDSDINSAFNFVYALFRLPRNAADPNSVDFMSAKSYSSIFRVLFNSTLFQWHLSEQVLALLAKASFEGGIRAGVPSGTAVAHKFGEAAFELPDKTVMRELHDCGIVYYPGNPYFLCVMTKGKDFPKLQAVVADISRMIWNFMSK